MKRFLAVFIVIIFFTACGDSKPKSIFSEKKMTNILFDLHLADAYISSQNVDTLNAKGINYHSSIYEKYNTDSAQVKKNLDYYASHPQDLQDVYAEVSKRFQNSDEQYKALEAEKYRVIYQTDSTERRRKSDSLQLWERDSLIHFNAKRDLFLDSTMKAVLTKDTLSKSLEIIDRRESMKALLNEQRRWERTLYYSGESSFSPDTSLIRKPKEKLPLKEKKKEVKKDDAVEN